MPQNNVLRALLLAFSWLIAASAQAAAPLFNACLDFFPNRTPPVIAEAPEWLARDLCFDAFAVLHSGTRKTPIFAVERLSPDTLDDARDEIRTNRFFADARLRSAERATLADYKGSGFDRGHMAPNLAIAMCGSGVTACHHLLAMERAGMPGARLFAPSWSGWISDPARPVATGE